MTKVLTLSNRVDEVTKLEGFVDEIAEGLSLDTTLCFNLNLVLEELASNIILYAFPKDEEHSFTITAQCEDNKTLTLTLQDDGVAFNPLEEAPEVDITLGAEDRAIGGLGIFLVRELMDSVSYERTEGKNVLMLKKNL